MYFVCALQRSEPTSREANKAGSRLFLFTEAPAEREAALIQFDRLATSMHNAIRDGTVFNPPMQRRSSRKPRS